MPGDADILKGAFNLPPDEAIKYFEKKGYQVSFDWHEMKREAHTRAFTVAGVTQLDVLVDIRKAVEDAQNTGKSFESFKKDLQPLLEKKGWWGKKNIERPDGSQKEVDLSAPWRLKTIYRTNMQTAYMAGRYKGMKDSARLRPYWKYIAVMDGRTRDAHRLLNGKILRHDDPFWDKYYPPNGWGCRCRVASLSKFQVEKEGLEVSKGEIEAVKISPHVPDGWDYNPGKDAWLPEPKNYPHWAKEKVETIVAKAKEQKQSVSYVETIDAKDKQEAYKTLAKHEQKIVGQDYETSIVVTKRGDVYRIDGKKDRVHPEVLGDDLEDAYVTHSHPADETEGSFSKDDFDLFRDFKMAVLRGVDNEFIYELNREDKQIDEYEGPHFRKMSSIDYWHGVLIGMAQKQGFGYRRRKR